MKKNFYNYLKFTALKEGLIDKFKNILPILNNENSSFFEKNISAKFNKTGNYDFTCKGVNNEKIFTSNIQKKEEVFIFSNIIKKEREISLFFLEIMANEFEYSNVFLKIDFLKTEACFNILSHDSLNHHEISYIIYHAFYFSLYKYMKDIGFNFSLPYIMDPIYYYEFNLFANKFDDLCDQGLFLEFYKQFKGLKIFNYMFNNKTTWIDVFRSDGYQLTSEDILVSLNEYENDKTQNHDTLDYELLLTKQNYEIYDFFTDPNQFSQEK
ncbi:hypothetical protein GVAV_001829 [Gurleya vavrai]